MSVRDSTESTEAAETALLLTQDPITDPRAEKTGSEYCSSWRAFLNIFCIYAGTGILGLPYTLLQAGWLTIALIMLLMVTTIYTGSIGIKCLYYDGNRRLSSFGETGYHAFGYWAKFLVDACLWSILLGVPVLYFILAGQNMDEMAQGVGVNIGFRAWTCISAAFAGIIIISVKNLKEVALISFFGSFAAIFCMIAVTFLSLKDLPNVRATSPPTHKLLDITQVPIALATISFAYCGNIIFPHVEESMQRPKDWNKVMVLALVTCAMMYVLTAFVGYYVYGDQTLSPILLNLPKGWILTTARILITAHVLLAVPILVASFSCDVERALQINGRYSNSKEFALRFAIRAPLTAALALVAVVMPYFGDVMSLLGALANCLLILVLPVLFNVKLYGWRSFSKWELLWSAFLVVIGIISCVVGTLDSVGSLMRKVREDSQ